MSFFKNLFGKSTQIETPKTINKLSDELRKKFDRNLDLMVEYNITIDSYCDVFEAWNDSPRGSEETYLEIHPKIKHILEFEFNEEKCERVKKGDFNESEMSSMITKLDADYLIYKIQLDYTLSRENGMLEDFKNGNL